MLAGSNPDHGLKRLTAAPHGGKVVAMLSRLAISAAVLLAIVAQYEVRLWWAKDRLKDAGAAIEARDADIVEAKAKAAEREANIRAQSKAIADEAFARAMAAERALAETPSVEEIRARLIADMPDPEPGVCPPAPSLNPARVRVEIAAALAGASPVMPGGPPAAGQL